jgi:hypothetical protein
MTKVSLIEQAMERGLTIGTAGESLVVQPGSRCPAEFAATLRKHKPELLALLRHEFLIVRSAVLNETVYFAANEQTRTALVAAGSEPGCIYTRGELGELAELNRRRPLTAADLLRIHETKRIFHGRIRGEPVR